MSPNRKLKGFTLIELLLVIAIIAVLAAIVIIAINPARQLAQANNAQRRSNVLTILNAVGQYTVDHRGTLPATIATTSTVICTTTGNKAGCTDLSVLTDNAVYLPAIPTDPTTATDDLSGYNVYSATGSRVTVVAPGAELSDTISVQR